MFIKSFRPCFPFFPDYLNPFRIQEDYQENGVFRNNSHLIRKSQGGHLPDEKSRCPWLTW